MLLLFTYFMLEMESYPLLSLRDSFQQHPWLRRPVCMPHANLIHMSTRLILLLKLSFRLPWCNTNNSQIWECVCVCVQMEHDLLD